MRGCHESREEQKWVQNRCFRSYFYFVHIICLHVYNSIPLSVFRFIEGYWVARFYKHQRIFTTPTVLNNPHYISFACGTTCSTFSYCFLLKTTSLLMKFLDEISWWNSALSLSLVILGFGRCDRKKLVGFCPSFLSPFLLLVPMNVRCSSMLEEEGRKVDRHKNHLLK